ncbi:unnamed protein product [Rhizoctonia solani]|uniref:Uncharacterized protein n=1 Tax=Rhizoctonia solani TaxID=456999 RepID=A0A8H3HYU6_9AGAM|nr:unnamed protein product [Rhizoctonia solani]
MDTSHITIPRLEAVLGLLRFPGEYQNFALPPLFGGCIELISSLKPSPFYYEYGYLSFHLMVVALTACLLSYGQCLDPGRDDTTAPSNILQNFWEDCVTVISPGIIPEEWGNTKLIRVPEWPFSPLWTNLHSNSWKPKLNILLNILHNDWKYFLIAIRRTRSLPLSGVMFTLRSLVHGQSKKTDGENSSTQLDALYASTLSVCRLVDSPYPREQELLTSLSNRFMPSYIRPQKKGSVDLEDSRYFMRVYIKFLERGQTPRPIDVPVLLGLVLPLVTPGCEDLLAGMFGGAMKVFWDPVNLAEPDKLSQCFELFLHWFRSNVPELLLRLTLLIQSLGSIHSENSGSTTPSQLLISLTEHFIRLLLLTQGPYLRNRLQSSKTLWNWMRYIQFFAFCPQAESLRKSYQKCALIIGYFSKVVLGNNWLVELSDLQPQAIAVLN